MSKNLIFKSLNKNNFETYFRDDKFTDMIVYCDGELIKLHRLILSQYSTFFKSILNKLNHLRDLCIALPFDVQLKDFKLLIEYIYRGLIVIQAEDDLDSIKRTANLLGIEFNLDVDEQNNHVLKPQSDTELNSLIEKEQEQSAVISSNTTQMNKLNNSDEIVTNKELNSGKHNKVNTNKTTLNANESTENANDYCNNDLDEVSPTLSAKQLNSPKNFGNANENFSIQRSSPSKRRRMTDYFRQTKQTSIINQLDQQQQQQLINKTQDEHDSKEAKFLDYIVPETPPSLLVHCADDDDDEEEEKITRLSPSPPPQTLNSHSPLIQSGPSAFPYQSTQVPNNGVIKLANNGYAYNINQNNENNNSGNLCYTKFAANLLNRK